MKKKTQTKISLMDRARANGALVNASRNRNGQAPKDMEMAAFMAVFHPSIKGKNLKSIIESTKVEN